LSLPAAQADWATVRALAAAVVPINWRREEAAGVVGVFMRSGETCSWRDFCAGMRAENDETRIPKDEGMSKFEARTSRVAAVRTSALIRHSEFLIRHCDQASAFLMT
jgi:hypothetical protein